MQQNRPMDHLVCGDVGLGKTEVAMRAAFKAVLDGKQVAVLVPTTLLALQHYHSFTKRLENFATKVEYLSRLKSEKEVSQILNDLSQGKIDILIGTHKILSKKISFSDLGLLIVDEEQRFGVSHKEQLKLLKATVDVLTLTATPIPRTLQLSLLGLKSFSLIQTPPPKRLSIKSYLAIENNLTIQNAIRQEIHRGGQVFIIHDKIKNIDLYAGKIRSLVPEATIAYAHGRLDKKLLERRMQAFYNKEFQVLISTTIVESGLDIPNANTMIIHQAHSYGLAQLHQLRGRIGRSHRKSYCYFLIPPHEISVQAQRRLEALQTYTKLGGSGAQIAHSDLEIRGSGDILSGHQSGHINTIGLELYGQLLKEAIAELKGEKYHSPKEITIHAPFPSSIPEDYIQNSSLRLKYYKKLSNCTTDIALDQLGSEIRDLFGFPPLEVTNLLAILKVKAILNPLPILALKIMKNTITLSLDKESLKASPSLSQSILKHVQTNPKSYKLTPRGEIIHNLHETCSPEALLDIAKELKEKILPLT